MTARVAECHSCDSRTNYYNTVPLHACLYVNLLYHFINLINKISKRLYVTLLLNFYTLFSFNTLLRVWVCRNRGCGVRREEVWCAERGGVVYREQVWCAEGV